MGQRRPHCTTSQSRSRASGHLVPRLGTCPQTRTKAGLAKVDLVKQGRTSQSRARRPVPFFVFLLCFVCLSRGPGCSEVSWKCFEMCSSVGGCCWFSCVFIDVLRVFPVSWRFLCAWAQTCAAPCPGPPNMRLAFSLGCVFGPGVWAVCAWAGCDWVCLGWVCVEAVCGGLCACNPKSVPLGSSFFSAPAAWR